MLPAVSDVHLFICLDMKVSPGAVLQCLDLVRAKNWQQECVLLCDEKWKDYVSTDQPVLFIGKKDFYKVEKENVVNLDELNQFLEQLDQFSIQKVTQIGDLSWGRWIYAYLDENPHMKISKSNWSNRSLSSIEVINDLASELSLDLETPLMKREKSSTVYIDPYEGDSLSVDFLSLISTVDCGLIPEWLNIAVKENDRKTLVAKGLEESLVGLDEMEMSLFQQSVLCFSDQSPFALRSRSYNVAVMNKTSNQSLFLPGDIAIHPERDCHFTEVMNILSYWKLGRLKELAFQWFNMGITVHTLEVFCNRVMKRDLLNYSSDLMICQEVLNRYLNKQVHNINTLIRELRSFKNNDPYSLSFSIKILMMIVERMMASAACGERLFQRLGSDYHRIIIAESLVEGFMHKSASPNFSDIDIKKSLKNFSEFLVKIDYHNDGLEVVSSSEESQ